MRNYGLMTAVVGFTFGLNSMAHAQQTMPGMPVGSAMLQPVGSQLPKVGTLVPKVGTSPNLNTPAAKQDPFGLQGYGVKQSQLAIDPKNAISPFPQGPATPEKSMWDKLYDRWLGLFKSSDQPTQNWTPGLSRRNRERKEERMRRD